MKSTIQKPTIEGRRFFLVHEFSIRIEQVVANSRTCGWDQCWRLGCWGDACMNHPKIDPIAYFECSLVPLWQWRLAQVKKSTDFDHYILGNGKKWWEKGPKFLWNTFFEDPGHKTNPDRAWFMSSFFDGRFREVFWKRTFKTTWRKRLALPFLPSWKWKMSPSNISFLSFRMIFHWTMGERVVKRKLLVKITSKVRPITPLILGCPRKLVTGE